MVSNTRLPNMILPSSPISVEPMESRSKQKYETPNSTPHTLPLLEFRRSSTKTGFKTPSKTPQQDPPDFLHTFPRRQATSNNNKREQLKVAKRSSGGA